MTRTTEPAGVSELAAELTGPLLVPSSPSYDEEVTGFNLAVRHRPDLVVGAANAADVQVALRYAAAHGLPVGVQATGHGASAGAIASGMLISTRRLDSVAVDPGARTATIGAGVRWREVITAAAAHGLAPLSGSSSQVGAIGYTLGGGLPVMCRTFGFAADRVRAVDAVTADGALRQVDTHDPELFWGLCGGKGNLGIVTAMTVELVPVTTVYGGGIFYAASHIPAVLHAYPAWAATLPEETSSSVAILRLPPEPQIPEPIRGQTVVHLRVCHVGDGAEGERLVAPMRAVAPALLDHLADIPYTAVDSVHCDPDHPVPFCDRGALLSEVTEETIDALLAVAGPDVHTPLMICELRQMGGALCRGPASENAVGGRDAGYSLLAIGAVTPETAEAAPAATGAVIAVTEPWSTGHTLVNLHGPVGDEADRARAWDAPTYRRLADLSRRLDPAGLLCQGHAVGRDGGVGGGVDNRDGPDAGVGSRDGRAAGVGGRDDGVAGVAGESAGPVRG